MSYLVVRAVFPLGTFLGHRGVAAVADFPDTARLHAALVHAAGKGSTAVERGGDLRPSTASVTALRWLEDHPPVGLTHPQLRRVTRQPVRSWRYEGTNEKVGGQPRPRKTLKSQSDGVAVGGAFEWGWRDAPAEVASVLETLCSDVSCLGEADAPVVLTVDRLDAWQGSLQLDTEQGGFPAPGGQLSRTPVSGRVDELEQQYEQLNPQRRPSKAADRHSWTAGAGCAVPVARHVQNYVYRSREPEASLPWSRVVLIETSGEIDDSLSVPWSVAFHRALVSRLPEPAPGLITGRYPAGSATPANRVAIHLLPATTGASFSLARPAFAVMVPADAGSEDLAALDSALRGLRRIYSSSGEIQLGERQLLDTAQFWAEPAPGYVRFWRPLPALVPEVRRQRSRDSHRWTLADAAALSAAHVFRDRLPVVSEQGDRRVGSVQAMIDAGFGIQEVHAIRDSRLERYAHKTPAGVTVQPYTGLVTLGSLAPDRALLALGQSRHLGGGLLFPEDVAVPVARARGLRG